MLGTGLLFLQLSRLNFESFGVRPLTNLARKSAGFQSDLESKFWIRFDTRARNFSVLTTEQNPGLTIHRMQADRFRRRVTRVLKNVDLHAIVSSNDSPADGVY